MTPAPVPASADDADAAGLPDRLIRKAETAVLGRTSRVVVVAERCTDEHNYSAIIRAAEALGVQHVWLVDPVASASARDPGATGSTSASSFGRRRGWGKRARDDGETWRDAHKLFAKRAGEFTTIREFPDAASCLAALREDGRVVWATDLSQAAVPMTADALREATRTREGRTDPSVRTTTSVVPKKLAIVFGTEAVGCTETMLAGADLRVYLPLRGFADSLNLSVAAALCLHQLFHLCPEAVGDMSESERDALRREWFPRLLAERQGTRAERKAEALAEKKLRKVRERILEMDQRAADAEEEQQAASGARRGELVALEAALSAEAEARRRARWDAAEAEAARHVASPPPPLRDMRRADDHREAFVGKGVKARNAEHWEGMPATSGKGGGGGTGEGRDEPR